MAAEKTPATALTLEAPKRRPSLLPRLVKLAQAKPLGAIGGLIVAVLVFTALFAPVMAPHDPYRVDAKTRLSPPGAQFVLGADEMGRDLFSRIVFGARVSMLVGLLSVTFGATTGGLIGVFSAFWGGKTDMVIQRLMDILMAFPTLILGLAVVAALGPSVLNVIIAISIVFVPRVCRVVRSAAIAVKEMQYTEAAKAIGCRHRRLVLVHILPNCLAPWIVIATAELGDAIVIEASLSFLGVGVPPPTASWGAMLSEAGRKYAQVAPWMIIFPALALSAAVFGINLLGDALRDILDPRLRRG